MPITWGAYDLGSTPPPGYLQDSSLDQTIETATIRDYNGPIVVAIAKPRNTTVTTVRTKGEVGLINVGQGD